MKEANGRALGGFYFEDEPQRQMSMKRLSRDEACLTAVNIAKLPSGRVRLPLPLAAIECDLKTQLEIRNSS